MDRIWKDFMRVREGREKYTMHIYKDLDDRIDEECKVREEMTAEGNPGGGHYDYYVFTDGSSSDDKLGSGWGNACKAGLGLVAFINKKGLPDCTDSRIDIEDDANIVCRAFGPVLPGPQNKPVNFENRLSAAKLDNFASEAVAIVEALFWVAHMPGKKYLKI